VTDTAEKFSPVTWNNVFKDHVIIEIIYMEKI